MEKKDTNQQGNIDEGLDVIELFLLLWKKKIVIITITVLITLLTGIYGYTQQGSIYHATMQIQINVPTNYLTKYGDYALPLTSGDQYINLIKNTTILKNTIQDLGDLQNEVTADELSKSISFSSSGSTNLPNTYTIVITSDDDKDLQLIEEMLYENYIDYLNSTTLDEVVRYFENMIMIQNVSISAEINEQEKRLDSYEKLLNNTQQFLITDSKNYINFENVVLITPDIINPEFSRLSSDIASIKEIILDNKNMENINNSYLNELETESAAIEEYYKSGDINNIGTYIDSIIDGNIRVTLEPDVKSIKTGFGITEYIIIGVTIGLFFSLCFVVIKEFLHQYLRKYRKVYKNK